MQKSQLDAYKAVQKTTETSGRDIEAAALTRCALLLTECRNDWDAADRFEKLSEAVRVNQIVWSIFQSELANPDNPLPKKLREDILSLSLFIDKTIIDILAAPSPEKLDIIININLNLAAGLRGIPA